MAPTKAGLGGAFRLRGAVRDRDRRAGAVAPDEHRGRRRFRLVGISLAVFAATAGATVSFLIGRYFLNDELEDWLTERRIFRAAKSAIDEEGWRIQILPRLSPAVPSAC